MPNSHPAVLVTAAALAPEAVRMFEHAGYAAITEHRPVALLHRQGLISGAVLDAGPEIRVVARHGAGIVGYGAIGAKVAC